MKKPTSFFAAACALLLSACTGENPPPAPTIDESCGLDCSLQRKYGLLPGTCFEYSDRATPRDPAVLGVMVREAEELEGQRKVIPVDYLRGGIRKMTDDFAFQDGALVLVRRSFPPDFVSYLGDDQTPKGVVWLHPEELRPSTTAQAEVVLQNKQEVVETTYEVTAQTANEADLHVPLQAYPKGTRLIFFESPGHGSDTQRVFVEDVGFIRFTSRLSLDPTLPSLPYHLQKIRQIPSSPGDGAQPSAECGHGSP